MPKVKLAPGLWGSLTPAQLSSRSGDLLTARFRIN